MLRDVFSRLSTALSNRSSKHRGSGRRNRRPNPRALGTGCLERLETREMMTVTYHGGALLPHVEAQAVYSHTSQNSFLGYHGAFAGRTASGQAVDVRYAVMPYPGSPNLSPSSQGFSNVFDELTSVTSHEMAEAVTDPDANYKTLGWYDDTYVYGNEKGGEIADFSMTHTVRLNNYLVQDVVNKNDQVIAPSTGSSTTTLSAPVITTLQATSSTTATIKWTAVSSATGYRLLYVQNGTKTTIGTYGPTITSADISSMTSGATYTFEVEAFNSTSQADSNPVSITMPSSTQLSAPQLSARAISSSQVQLFWGAVSGAQGYRIYWWNGSQAVLIGTYGSGTTSVNVNGLSPGTTNYFLVQAYNSSSYANSNWVSAATPYMLASQPARVSDSLAGAGNILLVVHEGGPHPDIVPSHREPTPHELVFGSWV